METIDAAGANLSLGLFTRAFREARKLAPARFLVMRIHPDTFKTIELECAAVAEVVQIGSFTGHLGKQVTRIACVPAPNGLSDGVQVKVDETLERTKLEFHIHGVAELVLTNLASDACSTPDSTTRGVH